MNWKEAEILIRHTIIVGMELDNRPVLEGPDFPCWGYDYYGTPGFKIRIGTTTCIEIPFIMLQIVYSDAIANNRTYENKVFKNIYERQLKKLTLIVNQESMQAIFLSGHKILCDGHVINRVIINLNILIMSLLLCDDYVIKIE
jgi:hypothetical protein